MKVYKVNQKVKWKWMGRVIEGHVLEVHTETIIKTIKGKKIKRNGHPDKPAYLVKSEAGNLALKLHTELEVAKETSYKGPKPKMFE